MRDGSNVIIRGFQGMVVEFHADDAAVLQPDRSHSRANHHFSAPLFDRLATATVKLAQRHGRDADPKTVSVSEECFPEKDRKSTRLNSSHLVISYAVFCLKKKKNKKPTSIHNEYHRAEIQITLHASPYHQRD